MARRTKPKPPAAPSAGYGAWRGAVKNLLDDAGIPFGTLRERDWRDLFIGGATPEHAAERAGVTAHNTRPTFGRQRRPYR